MVRPRRQQGFTLLELMIVVTIVAIVAALAAPAIATALNARRANEASLDLVRLAKRARSESAAYGRAHLLRVLPGASSGRGVVEMWRGINNGCNSNDWPTITARDCYATPNCVDQLDLAMDHYDVGSNHVVMSVPDIGGPIDICYQPTGVMQWREDTSNRFSDRMVHPAGATDLQGGVRFSFEPRDGDGSKNGVTRWSVLPLGGDPRTLR